MAEPGADGHAEYVQRTRELCAAAGLVLRFNMTHAPAGSSTGGQFASSSSGGGSKKSSGSKASAPAKASAAKSSPAKSSAHSAHPAAAKTVPHSDPHAAARKAHLRAQAKELRVKARGLEVKLHGLQQQEKKAQAASAAAAKTAKSKASAAGHVNPHAKQANPGAAHKTTTKAAAKPAKKTLKQQITDLHGEIAGLLTKANQLDAEAARL